uniref:Uncharacterized protein n=1 Tax=Capra hircus TaxID=9925 RepID=A0A8C2NDN4_CAPHI
MSRKQNQKDSPGFIFDLQSGTVLAQGGAFENMKGKINAVNLQCLGNKTRRVRFHMGINC